MRTTRQPRRRRTLLTAAFLRAATRRDPGAAGVGAARKSAVTRRLRLPALVVAAVVAMLAPLLQASSAVAANGLPNDFYANVYSPYTYNCVNVRNDSTAAGAWIQGYNCDGTGASDFYFKTTGADGVYQILGEHSHLCITPDGSNLHDGTPLVQWPCVGAQSQLWELLPAGGGTYELYNPATQLCLTQPDDQWWTILQIRSCNATPFQDFYLNNILAA
jgi:hypothetical protein